MKTDALFQDLRNKNNIIVLENIEDNIKKSFENKYQHFKDKFFYEQFLNCGGFIIDNWIRIYGCGEINVIRKNELYNKNGTVDILIGEDVLGGLFALKDDIVFYFAPDTNKWEDLNTYYTQFINWLINSPSDVHIFYQSYRWNTWKRDSEQLKLNEGYSFYPLLQFDYDIEKRSRKIISIDELIRFHLGI